MPKFLTDINLPYHFALWNSPEFIHQKDYHVFPIRKFSFIILYYIDLRQQKNDENEMNLRIELN